MDLRHGDPFVGPGFRAFDPDAEHAPAPDLAAEPEGFMVGMDGGVRIHFLDWGGPSETVRGADDRYRPASGDAVVPGVLLIHGLARTAWSWASIARRLRAVARVAAMDLRGHGLSDAPMTGYEPAQLADDAVAVAEGSGLLALADKRGQAAGQAFVVAGHGYGGMVAALTASALRERCSGLVLVDGGWTDLPAETGMTPDEWLVAIAEPPAVLGSMAAWLADRDAFDPATWGADDERAARTEVVETAAGRVKLAVSRHALAASVGALWTYRPASILPSVAAPIVALAARDEDAGRHVEALREIAAARAAAGRSAIRAVAFPELGHNLMRHAPDVVAAAILAAARPPQEAAGETSG